MDEPAYRLHRVRNIGIIAHIDAGKTTLTERILFYTRKIHRMGEVHEGTATMDWMDQERERGITITAAATTVSWRDHQINIVDTPGHVDFTVEVERSLRVLDGAVVLFSGVEGVESQSEAVWHQADRYRVPRLAFINKLDRIEADFQRTVEMMVERLGAVPLVLTLPWRDNEGRLLGMIDLLSFRAIRWDQSTQGDRYEYLPVPAEAEGEAREAREELFEKLSEFSDELAALYLDKGEIPPERAVPVIRELVLSLRAVPVFGGSALGNIGVQPLLDGVVDFLPSPLDVPPVRGHSLDGKEEVRRPDPDEPLAALVFKVMVDPYADRLLYTRIYSGRVREGEQVLNATSGRMVRITRLFRLHANRRQRLQEALAGDIVGLTANGEVLTGDTLCDPKRPLLLEKIPFPEPVVFMAVEPRSSADEDRLRDALKRISQEDPTFHVAEDPQTGQILVGGVGELQLEVQLRRLREEYKVPHRAGKPQVAYKATLARPVVIEQELSRTLAGKAQFARVVVRFEPLPRGKGFQFENKVPEEVLPRVFVEAVRRGIQEGMGSSPIGGFPVTDIRAILVDATYHPTDSTEVAFEACGAEALWRALEEGGFLILEPIAEGDIMTPREYLGEVVADLGRRRGDIQRVESRGPVEIIHVRIPLAETFGYATQLRSLTQGRASCTLQVTHYDVVPEKLAKEILRGRGYEDA
ncbi:MAG TPA: elongation factor G [Candidatus Acetothermia bacterium]|nr:elongation factor G [Candidatus Acetothermia bacterium]